MAGACRIVFVVSLVGVDAVVSGSRIMTNIAGGWGLVRSHLITFVAGAIRKHQHSS
jgi:hypothetical protein